VANLKSGPDYSVFITKYIVFQYHILRKMYLSYPLRRLGVPQVEDHCIKDLQFFQLADWESSNKISKEQCRINVYSCLCNDRTKPRIHSSLSQRQRDLRGPTAACLAVKRMTFHTGLSEHTCLLYCICVCAPQCYV
jgi:hypothetical protein